MQDAACVDDSGDGSSARAAVIASALATLAVRALGGEEEGEEVSGAAAAPCPCTA
jgi:hypothetical protein